MTTQCFELRTRVRSLLCGLAACAVLGAAQNAQAQTVVTGYSLNVPLAKLVPNPCTGGFESVIGNLTLAVTTALGSDFAVDVAATSSGQGDDALADGSLILNGTQKPNYQYSSSMTATTNFPNGRPSYFSQRLTVTDYLVRVPKPSAPDAFLMNVGLQVTFNNGVPGTPVITSIDVGCK